MKISDFTEDYYSPLSPSGAAALGASFSASHAFPCNLVAPQWVRCCYTTLAQRQCMAIIVLTTTLGIIYYGVLGLSVTQKFVCNFVSSGKLV